MQDNGAELNEYTYEEAHAELAAALLKHNAEIKMRLVEKGSFGNTRETFEPTRQLTYEYVLTNNGKDVLRDKYLCPDIYGRGDKSIENIPEELVPIRKKENLSTSALVRLIWNASDADKPFEDWAGEYGFDPDSRMDYAVYVDCRKTRYALLKVFGKPEFDRISGIVNSTF